VSRRTVFRGGLVFEVGRLRRERRSGGKTAALDAVRSAGFTPVGIERSDPRWQEAFEAGKAPRIRLTATHEATLEIVPLDLLKKYAIDLS